MKRNPQLADEDRARLVTYIKDAPILWDRRHGEYSNEHKKSILWENFDAQFFKSGGSSRRFYHSNRTTLARALNRMDDDDNTGIMDMRPSWQRALYEWDFLIPHLARETRFT